MFRKKEDSRLYKAGIIAAWLIIWQIVSMLVDNSILLVGPLETFGVLLGKVAELSFWTSIGSSFLRISAGFLAGWVVGLLLAIASAAFRWLESLLMPVISLMKTVPVASFVVLFLIWFRTDKLAIVISMAVVLPIVYLNTLEGIKSTDRKLLEMAKVYEICPRDKFMYIYRPALKPFWESCMKLSVGMSWKSGVAAEVIGTPDLSIGEQLYMSKIYLDTAGVLAWTVVIIGVSILCEKVFLRIWQSFLEWQPACRGVENCSNGTVCGSPDIVGDCTLDNGEEGSLLQLSDVSKAYDEEQILGGFNAIYKADQIYYFKTPSGSGKTTLFRLIADLEKPDAGEIRCSGKLAYAFQEDRLCEAYTALKNLELVCGDINAAKKYLLPLLDEADLQKPCSQLSGGMKRRVAVARAFAVQREIVLLDEPFSGLDEENRRKMQEYIREHSKGKVILIATHV